MKRSWRSVVWDHFELKNDLVHCQHSEAIPEAGGDKEPALSDTDEGSANTGAAARLAKLARSYLCITGTSVPSERRLFSCVSLWRTRINRLTALSSTNSATPLLQARRGSQPLHRVSPDMSTYFYVLALCLGYQVSISGCVEPGPTVAHVDATGVSQTQPETKQFLFSLFMW
ncbi:unnamed protein product [Pleuronectes platessa]|uniref:Uncharacterized protein n=1 Tax=Pleuronectes platessa TaxID=8262 RepID=A0A9N7UID7_PLEPL|nr:unnamed protein product [Pleuronectes platessa]